MANENLENGKKDQIISTNDNKINKFLSNLELVIKKYNIDINHRNYFALWVLRF